MKINKKGFTLVELLAVIVILAIIALIATPIILKIIEQARIDSYKDSAYGYLEAARLDYTQSGMDGSPNTSWCRQGCNNTLQVSGQEATDYNLSLSTTGDKFVTGTITYGDYIFAVEPDGSTLKLQESNN